MCSSSRLHVFYKTLCGFCCYFLLSHCLAGCCLHVYFSTAFLGSLQAIVICPAHLTRRFTILHLGKPQLQSIILDITMRVYPYLHAGVRANPVNHICLCLPCICSINPTIICHHIRKPHAHTRTTHTFRASPFNCLYIFQSIVSQCTPYILSRIVCISESNFNTEMHIFTCLIYLSASLTFSLFSN